VADSDYTEADLAVIRRAMSRGERTIQFTDRSVTYRSAEELIALEARIVRALAASSTPATSRRKQTRVVSSKGFC
jgi:hypothetical protein